jgi:hypothetical protein
MICGVQINLLMPASDKERKSWMEVSISGEPSSIPGKIWECMSCLSHEKPE